MGVIHSEIEPVISKICRSHYFNTGLTADSSPVASGTSTESSFHILLIPGISPDSNISVV